MLGTAWSHGPISSRRGTPALEEAQRRVRIAVAPAADHEHRTADRSPRRRPSRCASRARRSDGAATRARTARRRPGAAPRSPPSWPASARVRAERVERHHECAVEARVEQHAGVAAAIVAVVGVAIVREVDRHDARQMRRSVARHLERREAAVGDADHADVAIAPGLRSAPLDHVVPVALLAQRVLVPRRCPRTRRCRDSRRAA